jgi:phosphohistidine phosphatase SixA
MDVGLRPLSARGHRQARGIRYHLAGVSLQRVFSSSSLRCRETVEGLASTHGATVEVDERLRGLNAEAVLDLLRGLGDAHVAVCVGRRLLDELLDVLGVSDGTTPVRRQKGSVWELDGELGAPLRARYLPPFEIRTGDQDARRLAILDLGSTSFRLVVADAWQDGRIETVLRERAMLRLGARPAGAEIPEEVCQLALKAASTMLAETKGLGCDALIPVATAALRDAANGPELTGRLEEALDTPVRTLSGDEEARVVYTALRARLALGEGTLLAMDLGGGSLELAVDEPGSVDWVKSLPLGVVRLHSELVASDPMTSKELGRIRSRVLDELAGCRSEVEQWGSLTPVATGGTARAIARLVLARRGFADARNVRGLRVSATELEQLCAELAGSTHEDRLAMPAVSERRADLLPTGAVILSTMMSELDIRELTISDWGLREGIILEWLQGDAAKS